MKITGDAYFDKSDLMDIKAVSTLGITEDDVKAVRNVKRSWKGRRSLQCGFPEYKE